MKKNKFFDEIIKGIYKFEENLKKLDKIGGEFLPYRNQEKNNSPSQPLAGG